jgi:hypothetical protein
MQRLPATVELILVTVVPEKSPDIFNLYVDRSLEQFVRELWTAIRKAIAFPLRGVEQDLFFRHLHLRLSRENTQRQCERYQS